MKPLEPLKFIGILGGGQLAKMLAIEAYYMGYKTAIFDPNPEAPAFALATQVFNYEYNNLSQLEKWVKLCAVITYEFENIPVQCLKNLVKFGANLPQRIKPIQLFQNRLKEKNWATKMGFLTTNYAKVKTFTDCQKFIKKYGLPCLLKTNELGYDGKGQLNIDSPKDYDILAQFLSNNPNCIIEKKLKLDGEYSVVVIKHLSGEVLCLGPFENVHKNGILHQTFFPANIAKNEQEKLIKLSTDFINKLKTIGIITIEFFKYKNKFLINEVAPRPHNSGHGTIEAFSHSQFNLAIRAITRLPFPKKLTTNPFIMTNILGQNYEATLSVRENLSANQAFFHYYGKNTICHNRKMGHITALTNPTVKAKKIYSDFLN